MYLDDLDRKSIMWKNMPKLLLGINLQVWNSQTFFKAVDHYVYTKKVHAC